MRRSELLVSARRPYGHTAARRLAALVSIVAGLGFVPPVAAAEVLVLNSAGRAPLVNGDGSGFTERLMDEVFRRNGIELRLLHLPTERGLRNANAGIDDGDLGRIAGMEKRYPNLVRVPEKLFNVQLVGYARDPSISTSSWSALRPYRVGVIRGWKIYEDKLRGIVKPVRVNNAEQLFSLLERDRIDIALYERWMGLALIRQRGLVDVTALKPPLATPAVFTYLNKKHAALVPKLAATLRALKADGTYQRMFDETIGPLTRH